MTNIEIIQSDDGAFFDLDLEEPSDEERYKKEKVKNSKEKHIKKDNQTLKTKKKGKKKTFGGQCRKWFFTIWKMDIDWKELFNDYNDIIRFIAGQKEECPTSKKLHWQGCIHFVNPKRMTAVRRILELGKGENSGSLEPQKGTDAQCLEYVHKIETSKGEKFIFGEPSKQGKRTDIEDIKRRIKAGEKELSLYEDYFETMTRYRGFRKYRELVLENKSRKYRPLDVEILSGPTSIGKTRKYLYTKDPSIKDDDTYIINCSDGLKWFDGYQGEKTLILDEFNNQCPLCKLLYLTRGHQTRLEVKGGFTYALWEKVIITTNLKKDEFYPHAKQEHKNALDARVNKFVNMWPVEQETHIKCDEVDGGNIEAPSTPPRKKRKILYKKNKRKKKLDSALFSDDDIEGLDLENIYNRCELESLEDENLVLSQPATPLR